MRKEEVPELPELLRDAFKPGLRSLKAHFGLYPFRWKAGWQAAADGLIGEEAPRLQVAPVLERLVLPRAQEALLRWLQELSSRAELRWLVPAHYNAPVTFTPEAVQQLLASLQQRDWAPSSENWEFLGSIDQRLLDLGVVPDQPMIKA